MPDTLSPTIIPAPLPNPVISGLVQSPLERAYEQASQLGQTASAPPDDSAARLEAARAQDRGERPLLALRDDTPNARSDRDRAEFERNQPALQMRPNTREKRRAEDWATVNNDRDNLRKELETLRAGNGASRGGAEAGSNKAGVSAASAPVDITTNEEYKRLKAERDTYYEEIKHVRVEADPEFRAKFDGKRKAAISLAKGAARSGGDEVARILAISDPDQRATRLAEQIKDYSEGTKQQIIAANATLTSNDVERQIEIETRKATWDLTKASREQTAAGQWQQRVAKMDNEFSSVLGEWSDPEKGMPFLIDDAVKTRVVPEARKIFGGESDPRQLAQASLKAALFPEILRGWQQALQELEKVQGNRDQYRSSWPGSEQGNYNQPTGRATAPALNVHGYDSTFAGGLEAARARDMQGR